MTYRETLILITGCLLGCVSGLGVGVLIVLHWPVTAPMFAVPYGLLVGFTTTWIGGWLGAAVTDKWILR